MRKGIANNQLDLFREEYRYKGLWLTLLIVLFSLTFSAAYAQKPESQTDPNKVLFVGNSYTYSHSLPLVVSEMAKAKDINLACDTSTAGGVTLENHLKEDGQLNTLKMIKTGKYNAVVLQDQSLRPISNSESTIKDIGLFCKLNKKSKAATYLFLTWAREEHPQTQKLLTQTYMQASGKHGAKVVPVGIAWQNALKLKPGISLYSKDGSHPSQIGSYLSACVFFSALTGKNPNGLPNEIKTKDVKGETVVLLQVSKQNAEFCQKVAEQTMKEFTSEQR